MQAGWNQFDANEKLFGVVSSFDENLYTTKLDKTKIPNDLSRQAERIAMEIERQTTSNFHLQEERGQANAQRDGLDEEARYSSVDRKDAASGMCSRAIFARLRTDICFVKPRREVRTHTCHQHFEMLSDRSAAERIMRSRMLWKQQSRQLRHCLTLHQQQRKHRRQQQLRSRSPSVTPFWDGLQLPFRSQISQPPPLQTARTPTPKQNQLQPR